MKHVPSQPNKYLAPVLVAAATFGGSLAVQGCGVEKMPAHEKPAPTNTTPRISNEQVPKGGQTVIDQGNGIKVIKTP